MGKIIAGIGTSHVPSIGVVYDQGRTQEPDWNLSSMRMSPSKTG